MIKFINTNSVIICVVYLVSIFFTSMIRYLLFNAKLKMMKAGETQGVELCDTYVQFMDLSSASLFKKLKTFLSITCSF